MRKYVLKAVVQGEEVVREFDSALDAMDWYQENVDDEYTAPGYAEEFNSHVLAWPE